MCIAKRRWGRLNIPPSCYVNGIKLTTFGTYGRAYDKPRLCHGYVYGAFLFGMVEFASDQAEANIVIENAYDVEETSGPDRESHPYFLLEELQMVDCNSIFEKKATKQHPKVICIVSWLLEIICLILSCECFPSIHGCWGSYPTCVLRTVFCRLLNDVSVAIPVIPKRGDFIRKTSLSNSNLWLACSDVSSISKFMLKPRACNLQAESIIFWMVFYVCQNTDSPSAPICTSMFNIA